MKNDWTLAKDLEGAEKALSPVMWSRIATKLAYLIVILLVMGAGIKITYGYLYGEKPSEPVPVVVVPPPPPVVIDHAWFSQKGQNVRALEQEIVSAREALKRHQADVKSRSGLFSVSRKADRVESDRLNQQVLVLQRRRIAMIRDYNLKADRAEAETLGDLPKEISMEEKKSLLQKLLD